MVAPGKTLTLQDKIRSSTIRVEILIKIPSVTDGYVGLYPLKPHGLQLADRWSHTFYILVTACTKLDVVDPLMKLDEVDPLMKLDKVRFNILVFEIALQELELLYRVTYFDANSSHYLNIHKNCLNHYLSFPLTCSLYFLNFTHLHIFTILLKLPSLIPYYLFTIFP